MIDPSQPKLLEKISRLTFSSVCHGFLGESCLVELVRTTCVRIELIPWPNEYMAISNMEGGGSTRAWEASEYVRIYQTKRV